MSAKLSLGIVSKHLYILKVFNYTQSTHNEQINNTKKMYSFDKENQMSNKEDSEKIFIACMLMGLLLFAFALLSHVLEALL